MISITGRVSLRPDPLSKVARDLRARGSETNRTRPWGWPINRLVAAAVPAAELGC
jgi:hypothetical protein